MRNIFMHMGEGARKIFFHGKLTLFFAFVVILFVSFFLDFTLNKSRNVTLAPAFNVVELSGDVSLKRDSSLFELNLEDTDFIAGDSFILKDGSHVTLELNSEGFISLDGPTVITLSGFSLNESNQLENARFYMESGRAWVNNLFNSVDLNFFTNKALVVPDNAIFEIDYNGSTLNVYNNSHDIYIGLLAKPYKELERSQNVAASFYNYFFLPEGNRIQITEAKITEKLASLLLSKLVKEFPMTLVLSNELRESEWYTANQKRDNALMTKMLSTYVDDVEDTLVFNELYNIQSLYYQHLKRPLFPFIVSDSKQDREKELFLSHLFDIGQKWDLTSQPDKEVRAQQFYSLWQSSLSYLSFDAREYLKKELASLSPVLNSSELYEGKARVWNAIYAEMRQKKDFDSLLELLISNLEEVYDLIDRGDFTRALESFDTWSGRMETILIPNNKSQIDPHYSDVRVIRQMVNNLFLRYTDFYTLDHFEVLKSVDLKFVQLAPDQLTEEENRQTIIQDRIKILKKLSYLVQNNKIETERALLLADDMFSSVSFLRTQALYRVAIYDYFDSEIDDLKLLFEFYGSTEFKLLTGGFEEAFNEFQLRRQDWAKLQDYIRDLRPDASKVRRIDSDELIASVYEQFVNKDIFPSSIALIGDLENRLFRIESGKVGLQDFSGNFDNKTKLIYELEVNGKLVDKGVHIDKLREVVNSVALIEKQGGELNDVDASEELSSDIEYSSAEDLAIKLVVTELTNAGFFVAKDAIEIIDLVENRFYVEDVSLNEFAYTLSFEFNNTKDLIERPLVQYVDRATGQMREIFISQNVSVDSASEDLSALVQDQTGETVQDEPDVETNVRRKVKR